MNAQWQPRAAEPAPARQRAMALADLDEVLAIEQCAYPFPWSRGNFVDSLAAGYPAEVLVAGDGALLGYFVAMQGVDELHLLNITVAPAHQRQGRGRRLLASVEALGRRLALETLWLEVRAGNDPARALYRACGFMEMNRRRAYYPAADGREDAVVMRVLLNRRGGAADVD